ncbi:MAG: hypothetical protein RBQ97_06685 [Acholeplasma sp.]|nr:hypothetical protein [Acholeplasma sp.]
MNKTKIYKILRIIFIPPILVSALFLILFFGKSNIVNNIKDLLISIFLLGILPILAYPIISLKKNVTNKREEQRKLAFVLNIVGYLGALLYGISVNANSDLLIIYSTYALSVLILTLINGMIKFRASGHATSMAGPLFLLIYFKFYYVAILFFISYILVFISSIALKRHTIKEFIYGSFVPLIALLISIIVI